MLKSQAQLTVGCAFIAHHYSAPKQFQRPQPAHALIPPQPHEPFSAPQPTAIILPPPSPYWGGPGWGAIAVIDGGVISFVRTGHIGRPVFATNASSTKTWSATYHPALTRIRR